MDKIRIGNDIHIEWSIFRNNEPEVFEGKDVEVRLMHTRTRDVMPLEWAISDGVVSATFYGKDQIDTGDYKLMLIENNGMPNMATIDECKAFALVQCSCQEKKEEPSTSLQLYKVQLASSFALSGGGIGGEVGDATEIVGNEYVLLMDGDKVLRVPMSVLKAWLGVPSEPSEPDQPATPDVDENGYIIFADEEVKRVLMANGVSSDGVGITLADAEKVTNIGTWFKGNTVIETFDELDKFTGVTFLGTSTTSSTNGAFYGCTNLKTLSLPPSCADLRVEAIAKCSSLERVNGLEYVKTIRNRMGYEALLTQELNLINVEGIIGYQSFASTGITKVYLGDKVTGLEHTNSSGLGVFNNCYNLVEVRIPKSLESIGGCAFMNDSNLKTINGDMSNIKHLKSRAFYNCTSLEIEDLSLPNLETLEQNALYGVKIKKISDLGKITTLPTATTSTQNFGDKSVLEEVVLPETLTSIPRGSFFNYSNAVIEDLNLPNLTTIGEGAFNSTKLRKISSLGIVTRFEHVAGNVGETFENCTELTQLADGVLDNITYMAGAFKGCSSLEIEELRLPSLTGVLSACFSGCKIKKIIDLGTISEFYGASTLVHSTNSFGDIVEEIVIPNTVTDIGRYAFTGKPKLRTIVILASTPPTLNSSAFSGASTTSLLYVPDASVTAYQEATNWSAYASRIKGISALATDNAELYEEIKDYL